MPLAALSGAFPKSFKSFSNCRLRPNLHKFIAVAALSLHTMRVETDGLSNTITVYPEDGKHSASVILMHGKLMETTVHKNDGKTHWSLEKYVDCLMFRILCQLLTVLFIHQ